MLVYNRLMDIEAAGLRFFWMKREAINPKRCLDEAVAHQKAEPLITLDHLSGAFLVLAVGYGMALFSFLIGLFYHKLYV